MKIDEYVEDYFSRTLAIVNKRNAHDEKMASGTIVEK
jgi:hypothetical protein